MEQQPTYQDLLELNAILQERNRALEAENALLKKRLDLLEERVEKNSTNSSKPPSSDDPAARANRRKRDRKKLGQKRKRGGKRGHKGHNRTPFAPDRVDSFEFVAPSHCRTCHNKLSTTGSSPICRNHQVADIDPLHGGLKVVQYQFARRRCEHCGTWTKAVLPPHLRSHFGPRFVALVSLLTGRFHLSKAKVCELVGYLFKFHISPATICNLERQASCALDKPHQDALVAVQNAVEGRHGDETSWPQGHNGRYGWLWVLATSVLAVFKVADKRDKQAAQAMVGDSGEHPTVTDRYGSWLAVLGKWNQYCWAHLRRDFRAISQCKDPLLIWVGKQLHDCSKEVFDRWRQRREGQLNHEEMVEQLGPVRERVKMLLARGQSGRHEKHKGLCKRLLEQEAHLWVFLEIEGLAPDNNHAERLLRNPVLWRNRSGGTDSEEGSRFVERILTSIESLRLQGRDVLAYLEAAVASWRLQVCPPSLLPQSGGR